MPMYWDAYLADTTHLSTEEHGAYLLLLAAMWRRNGSVPDNDTDNARIIGLSKAKWKKVKARLSDFLVVRNGTISQKKLQETWDKTQEKIQKNRANGAKGGRPKSNENNDLTKPDGSVLVKPDQSIPEPEPEPEKEDKSSSSKEADFYQEYLDAHPKPFESQASERLFNDLIADGIDPADIIGSAKAYAVTAAGFSNPRFVQQSDNFLDPERGKWRAHVPKASAVRATDAEILAFYANVVIEKKPSASSTVSSPMAQKLLAARLVTAEQLSQAGVAS